MIFSYKASRCFSESSFESFTPLMIVLFLKITAAATTGPASGPLPASSTPARYFISLLKYFLSEFFNHKKINYAPK